MAVNTVKNSIGYGLNNALQNLSPLPIIAKREPSSSDVGELGQYWVYSDQVWMFTSAGTWTQLAEAGNAGVFTSLTVNGDSQFNGAMQADTGDDSIILNSGTGEIQIGADSFAKDITVGNITGASSLTLLAGTGAISMDTASTGNILINGASQTVAPIDYAFTQNAQVGSTSIVVPADIVANAVISIVMTNSFITGLDNPILCSVATNTSGSGLLQIQGMTISSDTLTISAKNVGSGTISSSTENVIVSYMILGNN